MLLDILCSLALERLALKCEERPDLPHREDAIGDECLYLLREAEQPNAVGNRRAAARDTARELLLGEAEFREQPLIGTCLLDGVQILALDVLDERHLGKLCIRRRAKYGGDMGKACEFCRAQATLSRDQLILVVADGTNRDGLEDTMTRNGLTQLLEGSLIELTPRLVAIWLNCLYGQLGGDARRCLCFL